MTYRLAEKTTKSESKEVWIVPGGQHNNTFFVAGPMYFIRLRQFMDKCKQSSLRAGLGRTKQPDTPIPRKKSPSPPKKAKKVEQEKEEVEIKDGLGKDKKKDAIDDMDDWEEVPDKRKRHVKEDAVDELLDDEDN